MANAGLSPHPGQLLMPLSLPYLQAHKVDYLGPNVASAFIQAVESGIIINQFFTFWSKAEREGVVLRSIVLFVSGVSLFQTAAVFYSVWRAHITFFGDWLAAASFIWVDKISSVVTVAMASPVQAFLIWRCWNLTNRSWYTLGFLSVIWMTTIITGIMVTVQTFMVRFQVNLDPSKPLPKVVVSPTFVLSLSASAALDVAVTTILMVYLSRASANVYSSRFRRIMRKLVILVWEAAVPPCVCAVLTVITYLTLVDKNYWDLTFQAILGKLYVISLFVTLNGRLELADVANPGVSYRLSNVGWGRSAPIRVDITRDLETQLPQDSLPSTNNSCLVTSEPKSVANSKNDKSS